MHKLKMKATKGLTFEDDIYDAISLQTCVDKRLTIGAPSPDAMGKVIEIYKEYLK